jgi:hypothetical protein
MNKDEEDFWNSSSVSSSIINNNNINDNDEYLYLEKYKQEEDNSMYEIKKIILPNFGYSNENKSFIFKFSTNLKEINGYSIPRIVNINLLNKYNFNFNSIYLSIIPLKYEYHDGLVVEIKYLKKMSIPDELILSLYAKKIELYLLELPTDDETYLNLGITVKKENIGHFCTINKSKNRNKKYAIDTLINNDDNDNF